MSFSKRQGLELDKQLQLESIDDELKNSLWNTFYIKVIDRLQNDRRHYLLTSNPGFEKFMLSYKHDFIKGKVDEMSPNVSGCIDSLKANFYSYSWNKIYDFLEYTLSWIANSAYYSLQDDFINELNRVLTREFAGYRIIGNQISPITNNIELREIQDAIFITPFPHVNGHLSKSLRKLSDRDNPDYSNSIKEAISAVESICRNLTKEATLGEALKKIELNGVPINLQFKEALVKLYAYTNSKETGIRHALIESPNLPSFDEAKFFIVACSAFINYLVSKTKKI